MAMVIRPYEAGDFEALVAFLREHWAPHHAIYDQRLFEWQYRIADTAHDSAWRERGSVVAADGARIVGFLGAIPGVYIVRGQTHSGAALALWVVARELRNSGLGVWLLKHVQERNAVVVCLGVNPSVVGMYQKLGYTYLPRLHRYVAPLAAQDYATLLAREADANEIGVWTQRVRAGLGKLATPGPLAPQALARLYLDTVGQSMGLSLLREAGFWRWRYQQSAGFVYQCFGSIDGAIMARVEAAHAPGQRAHGQKVLRVIELLPRGDASELLRSVLAWGVSQGCVAADYQCASGRFADLLRDAGFEAQEGPAGRRSLAMLLAPYRPEAAAINAVWKAPGEPLETQDVYLVKSDGDMDRPNFLATH